ncbi:NACHT domain-containing NTPase [Micromonospora sp. ALFpr18c]|uniref:NACHT domain-containing protein n=1 Tax=Micromonospora sp. ALFpr18c TaxID=1458665 RepID=UPI001788D38C|nr:NACHT domain-containing protein [Micromonospora sp. ALFpr18c]
MASVGAFLLALASLALPFTTSWITQKTDNQARTRQKLLNLLAKSVMAQWSNEERVRRLNDPEPIPVQWHGLGPPISDHWKNIRTDGESHRLPVDGRLADLSDVFETVLHRRRLVILGEAGAGKTVLATRLLLDLLGRRTEESSVPIIAPMASWDSNRETFEEWISGRLAGDYPVMHDLTISRELISSGQILPILDGFDEMAPHSRKAAIEAINRLGVHQTFVMTSRHGEYLEMIARGGILTAAAVIEIEELSTTTVRSYLTRVTPPLRLHQWNKVFSRLEKSPRGRLAQALNTPLMVSLAREAYARGSGDPNDLINARIRTKEGIEKHLTQALIPSVFDGASSTRWDSADRAHEWLSFLARWLRENESQEVRWWELEKEVEGLTSAAWVTSIAFVFAISWLISGLPLALMSVIAALGSSLIFLRRLDPRPSITSVSLRRFWKPFSRSVGASTALGLVNFAALGKLELIPVGFVVGIFVGVIVGAVDAMTAQVDTAKPSSPAAVLRASRSVALTTGIMVSLIAGGSLAVAGGKISGFPGLTGGFLGGMTAIIASPWGKFETARLIFAFKGVLPLRLVSFLEFCRERGILRQSGPQYQFRHILLLENLAPPKSSRMPAAPLPLPPVQYGARKLRFSTGIVGALLLLPACIFSVAGSKATFPDIPEITRLATAPLLFGICPTYFVAQTILVRNLRGVSARVALITFAVFCYFAWSTYWMTSSEVGARWAMATVGSQVLGTALVSVACWARRPEIANEVQIFPSSTRTPPTSNSPPSREES